MLGCCITALLVLAAAARRCCCELAATAAALVAASSQQQRLVHAFDTPLNARSRYAACLAHSEFATADTALLTLRVFTYLPSFHLPSEFATDTCPPSS